MIELKVRAMPHLSERYYFSYYDPIQQKEIYHPVAKEGIENMKTILQKRLGTDDIRLVTVYLEVETKRY
mgnify:CR=1 FL=1